MISGPSRTGDIEQTIVLGAHGPYRVHILIVDQSILLAQLAAQIDDSLVLDLLGASPSRNRHAPNGGFRALSRARQIAALGRSATVGGTVKRSRRRESLYLSLFCHL